MREMNNRPYPNLEAELKRLNLTQEEYGEKIGLTAQATSNRFNGKVKFSLPEIKKTLELLKKPFEELFM